MPTIDEEIKDLNDKLVRTINDMNALKVRERRLREAIAKLKAVKESSDDPDFVSKITQEFEKE